MALKRHVISILLVLSALTAWGERTIVPRDISEGQFALASSFLNKYVNLLDAPQSVETSDMIRRTKEDGLHYAVGNDVTLKGLSGNEDFSFGFQNGIYTAEWSRDGKRIVKCSFPANIGLLTFSNKIALEKDLLSRLTNPKEGTPKKSFLISHKKDLTKVSCSDFYVRDLGYYITPRLKHQIVYAPMSEQSDSCVMLVDSMRYNLESLANILLSGISEKSIDVRLKLSQYGYKSHNVNIPYHLLHEILSEYGSTPYWGVESFDGKVVKGLLVWTNPYGGFNHVLSLTVPIEAVARSCEAKASLHCYIRTDNLKSLFEEYPDI